MGTLVLGIIVAVILIGFTALYLWSMRIERDVVFWERKRRTAEEAQATQFNAAINLIGSVDR
ncbi:MAG TPA: hypothetical protein VGH30_06580 [Jatrophihabitantaceae bacterium]|jgi:uncharacterized iron-regulated membrane protein